MSYKVDVQGVLNQAQGQWLGILSQLAPVLEQAIAKKGHHVPCPLHGGKDGFRLFKDVDLTGGGVSNKDGVMPNGIALLQWVNGWDFKTALMAVADVIHYRSHSYAQAAVSQEWLMQLKTIAKYEGVIQRTGRDHFLFDPNHGKSTFLQLAMPEKPEIFWGNDLTRAIALVNARVGDRILIEDKGKYPVQVRTIHGDKMVQKKFWVISILERAQVQQSNQLVNEQEQSQKAFEKVLAVLKNAKCLQYGQSAEQSEGTAIVQKYLSNRGINLDLSRFADLKVVLSMDYFQSDANGDVKKVGSFPTLVSSIRDSSGELISIHRTYLTADGTKANVESPRKLMKGKSSLSGCAIRLGEPVNGILGVAEGLETALSVQAGIGLPTWACCSAMMLESFEPPQGVKAIAIFADRDSNGVGVKAALKLQQRLQEKGLKAFVIEPPIPLQEGEKGIDWNDILNRFGTAFFSTLGRIDFAMLKSRPPSP